MASGGSPSVSFPAHKTLLIARSPVFRAMFTRPLGNPDTHELRIDDIDPVAFKQVAARHSTPSTVPAKSQPASVGGENGVGMPATPPGCRLLCPHACGLSLSFSLQLLRFIYTDGVYEGALDAMADHLLVAAMKYQLGRLEVMCELHLSRTLTVRCVPPSLARIVVET